MRAHNTFYWITTAIAALVFLSGGAAHLLGVDEPKFLRLKKWAYAGSRLVEQGRGPASVLNRAVGGHPANAFRQRRSQ